MLGITPETGLTTTRAVAGITLRDVVFILFRRRWVVLAVCLPIILLGGTSLFRQSGSFTASSKVVVELIKVDLPQWNTSGRNVDYDRELSTLFNIAMSIPVSDMAAATLRDSIPVLQAMDPTLVGLEKGNNLSEFLLGGLDVSVIGESSILEFRFTSVHPDISLMAVGAMRDAFVDYQVHGRKNMKAVKYYEEQIAVVRGEIDSLLTLRGEVLSAHGYSSLKEELRNESGLVADMEGKLNDAIVVRKTLEMQYKSLAAYLDKDARAFPMGPDENRSHTLIYWRNLVGRHDDEMNNILTVHTNDSVVARRQQALLDESLSSLSEEQHNYVNSLLVSLDSAREKESALRTQITELRERNSRAPEVYQKVSLFDTEIATMHNLLEDLQGKRGEVRLSQMSDERVSNVVVLTEPELASILSGGKTVIYFGLIMIFAIALGMVAGFILEGLDHRIYAPKDIEENLKLPVFASVTKVE